MTPLFGGDLISVFRALNNKRLTGIITAEDRWN